MVVKRLLDCNSSDFINFTKEELKQSIKAAEGRTILSENVVIHQPQAHRVTNAEIAKAFGADLILLNMFDVYECEIKGLELDENQNKDEIIKILKKLVGRPIGLNLEPVDNNAEMLEKAYTLPKGRIATIDTVKRAKELGFDFICLTGNPGSGVSNKEIKNAIKITKENFDGLIIAGKMHGSGVNEKVCTINDAKDFIEAGIDILLAPAVGTVPGFREQDLIDIVDYAHSKNILVMSTIGTTQESSSTSYIEQIGIKNKIIGVDIQHIGDSGYGGLCPAENIFTLSKTIRGLRHTIYRMSTSINR